MDVYLETLAFELPEGIQRAKLCGDMDLFKRLLDARIKAPFTSPMMQQRLEAEMEILPRLERRYPYTKDKLIEEMRRRVPDFKPEELDALELEGCVDAIMLNGEKRYVSCCPGSLIKMSADLRRREVNNDRIAENSFEKAFIKVLKSEKTICFRMKIKSSLRIKDEFFSAGKWTVHIPVAASCAQQSCVVITADKDGVVASSRAPQRTVSYTRTIWQNQPFEVEMSYLTRINYVNPMVDAPHIVYAGEPAPNRDDLSEQYPHIAFTPYLRQLAAFIAGEETNKLKLAKKIYDYITLNVRYSYMRSYILIDRHAEYTALNMKGDCGLQALLFITLCRILGIPARWQSGLTVNASGTGDHDWAQFYTDEFGWLFADPSFGGGAHRKGDEMRREFYFGNIDPFRMVANSRYMASFNPPKRHLRADPYDSQDGEVESWSEGFDFNAYDKTDTVLVFEPQNYVV